MADDARQETKQGEESSAMEIDLVYLKALIEECGDPMTVCERSRLEGDRDSVAAARNTLLLHLGKPAVYDAENHPCQLRAMWLLGVDVTTNGAHMVDVFERVKANS